ncbi:MAG TPA: hypothetical protein VF420_13405 [Casimicrobiaceae bacterium]
MGGGYTGFGRRGAVQREDFDQWQNYGRSQIFEPPWKENEERDIARWQQATDDAPIVHTVMLALDQSKYDTSVPGQNHIFRWSLALGVGGSKRNFLIDAIGAQILALPISSADIMLRCERADVGNVFVSPTYEVTALAYFAEYPAPSRNATLTQWFTVVPGPVGGVNDIKLNVPPGANAWKLLGDAAVGAAINPFVATTSIFFVTSGVFLDLWTGDQLLATHATGEYVPIPGGAKFIDINNSAAGAKQGAIQWSMDF